MIALGMDIGGTNCKVGLVDGQNGVVLQQRQYRTNEYPSFQQLIIKVAEDFPIANMNCLGMGIAAPDVDCRTGVMANATNIKWGDTPLKSIAEKALGLPVSVHNDANAYSWGEMSFGNAKGLKDFIVLTLGTGLGSGIVCNGRLVIGHNALASEAGHIRLRENEGRVCGCGGLDHAEMYVSKLGILATAKKLGLPSESVKELEAAARDGNQEALQLFSLTGEYLGEVCAQLSSILAPQKIILAGGITPAWDLMQESCWQIFKKIIFHNFENSIDIELSAFDGKVGPIIGAASLVINKDLI